ncbi:MAG: (2Fe-2S) ferredoxin domain-containing protein [Spirochaetes bacterium]|nr:(2Fe-2S) ferredoxin domain-containing protein [Spirochaetota bacterium]
MEIKVCIGDYCHLKGSEIVVKRLQELLHQHQLNNNFLIKGCFCMGHCQEEGISVQLEDQFFKVKKDDVDQFFQKNILVKK